jgi:hypothetical protein
MFRFYIRKVLEIVTSDVTVSADGRLGNMQLTTVSHV